MLRPHNAPDYIASGPLDDAANMVAVIVGAFSRRIDLTDEERGAARAAYLAMEHASSLAWRRAYEASQEVRHADRV